MAKIRAKAYIMSADKFIKVGMARDLEKRLKSLDTGCPYPINIIWQSRWMSVNDARHLELHIQDNLIKYRVKGEWFQVDHITAINIAKEMQQLLAKYISKPWLYDLNIAS